MNKYTSIIIIFLISCNVLFAQNNEDLSTEKNDKKNFYLKFGTSMLMDNYFYLGDLKETVNDSSLINKGGFIEFGNHFSLLKNTASKSDFGIDVTYFSGSRHMVGYKTGTSIFDKEIKRAIFYNIGSKFGLYYSYNIIDDLYVNIFAKLNPIWVNVGINQNMGGINISSTSNPITYYTGFAGFKACFGLDVRYDFFMLNAELNLGNLVYESVDKENIYIGNIMNEDDRKTNSNVFNLGLGFCF